MSTEEKKNKYTEYMDNIRKIQTNVFTLNEDEEKEDKSDEDLDALLKDNDGDDKGSEDLEDLEDNKGSEDSGEGGDDLGDLGDDEESEDSGEDLDLEANNDEKDSFETDNEGLMDTITKLTKSGHTVKIIVSAESKEPMLSIDGKKATLKQLSKMLSESKSINKPKISKKVSSVKGSVNVKNNNDTKIYKALMEQINMLNKKVDKLNKKEEKVEPIIEEKFIQIKESDYNALIEMAEDMNFKIDEQEAIIKNYETMNQFNTLDESSDEELNEILNDLNESVNELNNETLKNRMKDIKNSSFCNATDISLGIMSEDIIPILSYTNAVKATVLAEMDSFENNHLNFNNNKYSNKNKKLSKKDMDDIKLSEGINIMKKLNKNNDYKTLIENKLSDKKKYSKKDIMNILDEITGTLVIADSDYGYDTTIDKPDIPPTKHISNLVSKALSTSKGNKSEIQNIPEDNWDFQQKSQNSAIEKKELPIMNYQQITTPTIKSAIANLTESLIDIDGNVDLKLCEQAYLYKRVSNPQSIKDFAMPIAIMEQKTHKLYAHPKLIENVANILKSDSCMKTYNIDSRETLYNLRESLLPYLEKIGMKAPWIEDKKSEVK